MGQFWEAWLYIGYKWDMYFWDIRHLRLAPYGLNVDGACSIGNDPGPHAVK